jgi:NAD(P)-dependent dehydrogenase (short-subunit alcohol dehydrogenase family)
MRAEDQHIESMLKTNLQGAIFSTREMTRRVPRQQNSTKYSKSIINISSLLAFKGAIGTAAYASTKAGLIGLTRAVAVESSQPVKGTRIRANAIVPGYIETKMLDGMSQLQFHFSQVFNGGYTPHPLISTRKTL